MRFCFSEIGFMETSNEEIYSDTGARRISDALSEEGEPPNLPAGADIYLTPHGGKSIQAVSSFMLGHSAVPKKDRGWVLCSG